MTAPLPVGLANFPKSAWGTGPDGTTGGPYWGVTLKIPSTGTISDDIDEADANNILLVYNFADSRDHWTDPSGADKIFNPTEYEAQVDEWSEANLGSTLFNKIVDALQRRRIIIYAVDEAFHPVFAGSIDGDDVNWMGGLYKALFGPDCIVAVRMDADLMETHEPVGGWTYIDYLWSQYEASIHVPSGGQTPAQFYAAEWAKAQTLNLGMIPGHNWLDGGAGVCWDYLNTGSSSGHIAGTFTAGTVSPATEVACGSESTNTRWYTPPAELQGVIDGLFDASCADALAQAPFFLMWSYSPRGSGSQDAFYAALQARADVVAANEYFVNTANSRSTWTGWRTPKGVEALSVGGAMPLLKKATSFNLGTGAAESTVEVAHGLGEAPKAIKLLWSGRTENTDAAGNATYFRGEGRSIGASGNHAIGSCSAHNGAGGSGNLAHRGATQTACILEVKTDGTIGGKAIVQSWDATNVVFEIVAQFSADFRIAMQALGGGAIQNVHLAVGALPITGTAPFTEDLTGFGFTPLGDGRTLVDFLCPGDQADFDDSVVADSGYTRGVATAADQQGVMYHGADNLSSPNTVVRSYTYPAECLSGIRTAVGSLNFRAAFSAWITDGMRINHLERQTYAVQYSYLVIDGPLVAVLQGVTSTSNGADIALTGAGFEPECGEVFSIRTAQNTQDTPAAGTGPSVGFFDGTSQVAHGAQETNNLATSNVRTAVEHDACYVGVNSSGSVVALMALQSLDADGVTFDMTDGDEGAYQFHVVLMAGLAGTPIIIGLHRIERGIGAATAAQLGGVLQ